MADRRARARERTCAAAGHHVWGAGREPCMVCGAQRQPTERCAAGQHAGAIDRHWYEPQDRSVVLGAVCYDCGRAQAVRFTSWRLRELRWRARSATQSLAELALKDLALKFMDVGYEVDSDEAAERLVAAALDGAPRV